MATTILDDMEIKAFLGIEDSQDDVLLFSINAAASAEIQNFTGRSFVVDPDQAATTRVFRSLNETVCQIDDCWSITLVETDNGNDGTYSTSWSSSDWYAHPANGMSPTGISGWPYTSIQATRSKWFPWGIDRPNVRVTAKWGWSELPAAVNMAGLQLCGELYRSRTGGYDTWTSDGGFTTIRQNRIVRDLLQPYRRMSAGDGRFMVG